MFGSLKKLPSLAAVAALLLLPATVVQAQGTCGGLVQNGTFGTYSVIYDNSNFTILTMYGSSNIEKYVLYCGLTAPDSTALAPYGLPINTGMFQLPLAKVIVGDTFSSSYIEISGHRDSIAFLDNPQNVVSPCLQENYATSKLLAFNDTQDEWTIATAGFLANMATSQPKAIWIPASVEVDPLYRIEYITAVSLFYNDGVHGQDVYNQIKSAYTNLQADMAQIPSANRNRIGWVYYNFALSTWKLKNDNFTTGLITAAGGQPFPLSGETSVGLDLSLSSEDIKTLLLNAQFVIDQTDFTGQPSSGVQAWMNLAGFNSVNDLPVLENRRVYTLNNVVNAIGVSDYNFRFASRPDILLKDLIYVQYQTYNPSYRLTFINQNWAWGGSGGPSIVLTAANCTNFSYNNASDIPVVVRQAGFRGNSNPPPPPTGSGIYGGSGSGSNGGSGGGGSNKTKIIVPIICVVVILGAAFGFVFFKWGKRAKEDRFIELEEEMNNEIPLH
ncbi:hypothetical protein BGZ46_005558 [Entomortierella lignicola]|nr:hypothetical protein BGZ46_005558 [Entomortierella lignicola]